MLKAIGCLLLALVLFPFYLVAVVFFLPVTIIIGIAIFFYMLYLTIHDFFIDEVEEYKD